MLIFLPFWTIGQASRQTGKRCHMNSVSIPGMLAVVQANKSIFLFKSVRSHSLSEVGRFLLIWVVWSVIDLICMTSSSLSSSSLFISYCSRVLRSTIMTFNDSKDANNFQTLPSSPFRFPSSHCNTSELLPSLLLLLQFHLCQ